MPQSYPTEILRLNLQFIHCIFFSLIALLYCTARFTQSFATFSFTLWMSIYPQIPDFKSFIEKIGALDWRRRFALPRAVRATHSDSSASGPLRAHGKAPLWHTSTHLLSEHRSVYKTVYQVVCIHCTWVAFKIGADDFTLPSSSTLFSLEMTVGTCATEVSESLCPDRGVGVSSSSFLL